MELHVATIAVSSQDTAIWHRIQPAMCWQWVKCGARNKATLTNTHLQDKLTTRFMEELQLQRATIRTWDAIGNSHSTQWAISPTASSTTPMMATAGITSSANLGACRNRGPPQGKMNELMITRLKLLRPDLHIGMRPDPHLLRSNKGRLIWATPDTARRSQCRKLKQRHPVPVISVLLSGIGMQDTAQQGLGFMTHGLTIGEAKQYTVENCQRQRREQPHGCSRTADFGQHPSNPLDGCLWLRIT